MWITKPKILRFTENFLIYERVCDLKSLSSCGLQASHHCCQVNGQIYNRLDLETFFGSGIQFPLVNVTGICY